MNSTKERDVLVKAKGKCIWLKEEGASVYAMEEIGYFVLDNSYQLPLRAPVEGTISSILVHGDEEVDGTNTPVTVAKIKTCTHGYVINNMCLNCYKILSNSDLENYRKVISHDGCLQYLHPDTYQQESLVNQKRLLATRRLGLVFDLDNTLMEQTDDPRCSAATSFGIPNIHFIQFKRNDQSANHIIILRPEIQSVLTELSKYYELSIYTNGVRKYAQAVIQSIDPTHQLFGSRVIARDDVPDNSNTNFFNNFLPASKDISFVLPGLERLGVVVDDSMDVWKDRSIVLQIPKFRFWQSFLDCYDQLEKQNIKDDAQRRQKMFEAVGWIINNGSLNIVKDTLVQIHHQFYEQVQNNGTEEFSMSVGRIIERMRASLFRNTIILFDETFSEQSAGSQYLFSLVKQMGGKIVQTYSPNVTHFISTGTETKLLKKLCVNPPCKLVNEQWIVGCYAFVQRISAKCYPVRGIEQLRERLQNPKASQPLDQKEKKEKSEPESKETEQTPLDPKETGVDPDLADVLEEMKENEESDDAEEELQDDLTLSELKSKEQSQLPSQQQQQQQQQQQSKTQQSELQTEVQSKQPLQFEEQLDRDTSRFLRNREESEEEARQRRKRLFLDL